MKSRLEKLTSAMQGQESLVRTHSAEFSKLRIIIITILLKINKIKSHFQDKLNQNLENFQYPLFILPYDFQVYKRGETDLSASK